MDRERSAPDTDGATKQTIGRMCQYIHKVLDDDAVRMAANFAWRKFGASSDKPGMRAWGVYWYVKHCIKFQQDEATMFRIGEPGQQDLLTAPDVLLRMDSPAEDCDGFTMLECALLSLLGVKWVIVTVAVDPGDRSRWSHVFPMAIIDGTALPLDASHGSGPGWMVPQDRIYRWQCWDESGNPVDVKPPAKLGHYVKRGQGFGGLGDCVTDPESGLVDCSGSGVYTAPATTTSSAPPASSFNLNSFLNNLVTQGAKVASIAETPITTISYPGGPTVTGPAGSVSAAGAGFSMSGLSGILPWLAIGLVGIIAVKSMGSK